MSYSVLIVDDSPATQKVVERVLQISGLPLTSCVRAGNGREALDRLRHTKADLILTDINMPEMNGEELVRSLQRDEDLRQIPVIVLSSNATLKQMQTMIEYGARGYVTKPFTPQGLRDEIQRVLGGVDV